jgi:two-component system, OmpR family, response regulator
MSAAAPSISRDANDPIRVLLVEDDAPIAASLVRGLRSIGFSVELCTDGDAAAAVAPETFDIAVFDLNLPGKSGLELVEHFRTRTSAPAIILTAATDLQTRLLSFSKGAADFLAKPFFLEELVARIEARLGKTAARPTEKMSFAGLEVDLQRRTVTSTEGTVDLTAHEFNILAFLIRREGRPATRQQLANSALSDIVMDTRTVDSHVARIRKKCGVAGVAIVTVWGIGYAFRP